MAQPVRDMGRAIMATGVASGLGRATEAAKAAVENPLFNGTSLRDAKGLLVSISAARELTLLEVDEAAGYIRNQVNGDTDMILGANLDDTLGNNLRVSIIASGLNAPAEVVVLADHVKRRSAVHETVS
ncbi:hypothetical protein [Rhizobium sp. SL42]|uniref:hypothetical protein n=1 Tax=Rhizobium sp. SL42 TaxID=2806346 RepID=UPI001F3A254E|nr:hypothetical protein [Rhizobium sp. SL42]UJW77111.1 hypothetical protein IM739_21760 [Rhizobium sp. SL42]